jgi:hypothetical protein
MNSIQNPTQEPTLRPCGDCKHARPIEQPSGPESGRWLCGLWWPQLRVVITECQSFENKELLNPEQH